MGMAQQKTIKNIIYNLKFLKNKKVQLFLRVVLVLIIFFNLVSVVFGQREKYFSYDYNKNYPSLEKIYYDSIYKNKHGNWVPDEILYSYISGALVRGKSPILLNPEVPPFGTYIIGVSTILFNNQSIVIIFFAIISLFLMYLLGRQIYDKEIFALLPPTLLSFEPIFKNQLIYTPLLDIIQLTFLLLIFYFFNKSLREKKNFIKYVILTNIFFGFFISTKFFGTGITIIFAILVPLFIHKEWKRLKWFLITMPIAVFILYANYLKVLIDGYPFSRFLGIQKWIFLYNKGHLREPFSIWPLLLLNRWYLTFGSKRISSDPQWLISWPIVTIVSFSAMLFAYIKKIYRKEVEVMFFWVIAYCLLMSFADASARYFVILVPILYMVSLYGIIEFVKVIRK